MTANGATVLRVGRLVDGTSAAAVEGADVRVVAGRLDAIGAAGTLARPGDRVVDRPTATCTPGFVDVHTHFCYPRFGDFQLPTRTPSRMAMLAGGGFRTGQVIGATDKQAAAPTSEPIGVSDLLYTISTLLGINPEKQYYGPLGRPVPIVDGGKMITGLV